MRALIYAILLTMLAQPVWAFAERGNWKQIDNDFCKKVMAKGVYLGHVGSGDHHSYASTESRFFYKGEIYLIGIWKHPSRDVSGWECKVLIPKE